MKSGMTDGNVAHQPLLTEVILEKNNNGESDGISA